jgi:hypothetical protein
MATKNLQDLTLKNVFENAFGKKDGDEILSQIQEAYNKGATGAQLKAKADEILAKHKPQAGHTKSLEEGVATAATTAATTAAIG